MNPQHHGVAMLMLYGVCYTTVRWRGLEESWMMRSHP